MFAHLRVSSLAIAAFMLIGGAARAGEITGIFPFAGINSVAGESVATGTPGNDDFNGGLNPNVLSILQKDYRVNTPVDIVLEVNDAGNGTTEYAVVEGVQNSSGVSWSGYRIELGFGTGDDFVPSTDGDGLDFDTPDLTSLVDFNPGPGWPTVTMPSEDELVASGATISDFTYVGNIFFSIDVPDGIENFTLRQQPIPVPEPGALALAGIGLVGLCWFRIR